MSFDYFDLRQRERATIEGEQYEFDCVITSDARNGAADELQFTKLKGRRAVQWTVDAFDELYRLGKVLFGEARQHPSDRLVDDGEDTRPETERSEKEKRERLMRRVRRHYLIEFDNSPVSLGTGSLSAFIADAAKRFPEPHDIPSPGNFRRWLKRGSPGDRRACFMGNRWRRGPGAMRIHKVAQDVLVENAEEYWDCASVTPQDVYGAVVVEIATRNSDRAKHGLEPVKAPSYETVWRYLRNNLDHEKARRRMGPRAADQIYVPLKGALEVKRILDKAIVDHTILDCFAIDDESQEEIGRPYLTLIIDVKSRYPLGFHLGFEPPSVHTVMAALRMSVCRKTWINQEYPDIDGEWEAWGKPRVILADNGWEFTGISFADACANANISVEWAGIRNPQYKGICERAFGTIRTQFSSKLPGGIPFKPEVMKQLGLDAQGQAVLTISQIHKLLCHYFIEVYGNRIHTTLKKSPRIAWRERVAEDGILRVEDMNALLLGLGRIVRDKRLTREGIKHRGLTYQSPDAAKLLNDGLKRQKRRGVRKGSLLTNIKEFPEDVSRIAVPDEERGTYIEFVCSMNTYPVGLSIRQHKAIQKSLGSGEHDELSETELCARREKFRHLVRSMIPPSNIRNRKRLIRLEPPAAGHTESLESVLLGEPGSPLEAASEIPTATLENCADLGEVEIIPPRGSTKKKEKAHRLSPISGASSKPAAPPSVRAEEANPLKRFDLQELLANAAKLEGIA